MTHLPQFGISVVPVAEAGHAAMRLRSSGINVIASVVRDRDPFLDIARKHP
jgi:hypothetical protein